jgi:hypothetical protein
LLAAACSQREQQELVWINGALIPPEAAQSCGGATPPCCYNVCGTSVEGTASMCCASSRGEYRPIGQQEFNPELLEHKIYSKILDKNKFYYR